VTVDIDSIGVILLGVDALSSLLVIVCMHTHLKPIHRVLGVLLLHINTDFTFTCHNKEENYEWE
jgi:hypothetical protein